MPIYTYLIKVWPKIYSPEAIRNAKKKELPDIRMFYDRMYQEKGEEKGILSYSIISRYPNLEVIVSTEEKLPKDDTSGDFIGFIVDPDRAGEYPVSESDKGKTYYGGFITGTHQLLSTD